MLTNPVVISVIVMAILCLLKLPVILSLLLAALTAGVVAGIPLGETMGTLVSGMGGNANTALSYILLGALAACIHQTGAASVLAKAIGAAVGKNKFFLAGIIVLVSMASGTIIPVHIAFIPILIPPLLSLMNKIHMDRRMAAISFGFGLKAPYITLPVAYGYIFHNIIKESMAGAGLEINLSDIWHVNWVAGLAMFVGLIIGWIVYSRPRDYVLSQEEVQKEAQAVKIQLSHWITLVAGIAALVVQIQTESLPLGALAGLAILILSRTIKWSDIEAMLQGGVKMMGMIAFVMLVAAGYAAVIKSTGGVETLVDSAAAMMHGSKLVGAIVMVFMGLLVTMGIGTSFGTVPILAAIYVPLSLKLGFSPGAIIFMIAVAGALGDAGSPASDTTLGPTAGLNADGQHDHIWDTCVPQFLCYNIPLMIAGVVWPLILG